MPSPLTLLTVNLWNGRAHPEALGAVLERHRPDVLLAQELAPEQAEASSEASATAAERWPACAVNRSAKAGQADRTVQR
jgi:hypothetical protein